jgi:hypothetical protein
VRMWRFEGRHEPTVAPRAARRQSTPAAVATRERMPNALTQASGPRGATFVRTPRNRSIGNGIFLARYPGLAEALLDIRTDHATHDLRRREVFLGAKPLEQHFLAGVDQDGKTSGTLFEPHDRGVFHVNRSGMSAQGTRGTIRRKISRVIRNRNPAPLPRSRRESAPEQNGSGAPSGPPRGSLRRFRSRCPRLPRTLLDVASNESPHDLGGCRVLLSTQALEKSLLARIDEDCQSCGAVFESHGRPLSK